MDNDLARSLELHTELWSRRDCFPMCSYRLDVLPHFHEQHVDGSRAVIAEQRDGLWALVEFQGSLGF